MANLSGHARKKWRALGYFVEAGEHITRMGSIVRRHDTFGFADLLCVREGQLVLLQVTSWGNVSARANKIARETTGKGQHARPIIEIAKNLLLCYAPGESHQYIRIVVEGWRLDPKTNRWVSREIEITHKELDRRAEHGKTVPLSEGGREVSSRS